MKRHQVPLLRYNPGGTVSTFRDLAVGTCFMWLSDFDAKRHLVVLPLNRTSPVVFCKVSTHSAGYELIPDTWDYETFDQAHYYSSTPVAYKPLSEGEKLRRLRITGPQKWSPVVIVTKLDIVKALRASTVGAL